MTNINSHDRDIDLNNSQSDDEDQEKSFSNINQIKQELNHIVNTSWQNRLTPNQFCNQVYQWIITQQQQQHSLDHYTQQLLPTHELILSRMCHFPQSWLFFSDYQKFHHQNSNISSSLLTIMYYRDSHSKDIHWSKIKFPLD